MNETSTNDCPTNDCVKVIHGPNSNCLDITGMSVAAIQAALQNVMNIPMEAFGYVDGTLVGENFRVPESSNIEFVFPWGRKGAKRSGDDFRPMKQPFPYIGGKSAVAPEIWRRFGTVENYVEPFLGGGAVLLGRPDWNIKARETVNDIDNLIINFWRSAKFHPRKLARVADYPVSELDLHARHEWFARKRDDIAKKIRKEVAWCDPRVAAWWVWGISQWIGGGWCATGSPSLEQPHQRGRGIHRQFHQRPSLDGSGVHRQGDLSRGGLLRDYFEALANRLERVRLLNGDWSRLVTPSVTTRYGTTGIFLDPPYIAESGRQSGLYANDDLLVGHRVRNWAVANGENRLLRIALCGYAGDYDMPASWQVFEWKSKGSRNGPKERIWFSPYCLP